MKLSIDLGNYNVKTSEGIIFSSKYDDHLQAFTLGQNVIEYEGKAYMIGIGKLDKEQNKYSRNYMPLLLQAIEFSNKAKATTFDLVLGIPIDQSHQIPALKKKLAMTTHKYKANNVNKTIKINKVEFVPEGISATYAIDSKIRLSQDILLIDIGGMTVNCVTTLKGVREKVWTHRMGTIDIYQSIYEKLNAEGTSIQNVEEVARALDSGYIKNVDDILMDFLKKLLNEIKKEVNTQFYEVYFTGGGSIVLKDTITKLLKTRAKFVDKPLYSNVDGNNEIMKNNWK